MLRKAPPCGPTISAAREKSCAVSARLRRRDPCQPTPWLTLLGRIRSGRAPRGRREDHDGRDLTHEGECGGRGAHAWKTTVRISGTAASIALTISCWFKRHRLRPMSARDRSTIEVRSAGGGGGMAMAECSRERDGAPSGSSAPCGDVTSESIRCKQHGCTMTLSSS